MKDIKSLQTTITLNEEIISKNQMKLDEKNGRVKDLQNEIA